MNRRLSVFLLAFVTLTLVAAGCSGGGGSATLGKKPITTTMAKAPSYVSYFASANSNVTQVAVFSSPTSPTPKLQLPNPWLVDPQVPTSTVLQVFLVQRQTPAGWVKVLLPVKPNGSSGWIHAADVTLTKNTYQIKVSLGAHTIAVSNNGAITYQGPIATGATDPPLPDVGKPTPTPTGRYYLRVLLMAPDPTTVYGPYAYGLSSHSETLDEFAGGDAEIGIHGNNDASVLGKSVTHGCVRMDNTAITALAKQLPLGTPVDIVA
jgi:lipoprotein-anchoring transpeptidase ErfK/SrfK